MSVKLPDVSEYQSGSSAPDWAGIKSQNGGAAIIRVGYGNSHVDAMLGSNRAALKAHGFSFRGLYQYLVASQDVSSQADAFRDWIGPSLNDGEIPILDLEEGSGSQMSRANQWFDIIDDAYHLSSLPLGQRSWLYSGQDFAVSAGLAPIFHSARPTWVAAYQASDAGLLPHTLWQSTNGQVGSNMTDWSGCGYCDTSYYGGGDLAGLSALAWHPSIEHTVTLTEDDMQIPNDKQFGAVSFGKGQYTYIAFFCDSGGENKTPNKLRVAPFSSDINGFANITVVTVGPATEKVTVDLPKNCSGISFQRQDDESNWATIAYNLG